MDLLILADDDMADRRIPPGRCDVIISCGDLLDAAILRAAGLVQAKHLLAVKGNHDGNGKFPQPIVDLHLATHEVHGVRFGGFAGAWRYKPRGHHLFEQHEVRQLLASFPPVDVFVAHNSPRSVHERDDDVHQGFDAFNDYIERAKPRLFLHGHQHVDRTTQLGDTSVVGVFGAMRMAMLTS